MGSDDEEDVGDVRIGGVYLMHVFGGFWVVVADAGKIFVYFLVSDILLVDIQQVLG